jgi:Rieske Fe-S protein
MDNEKVSRRKFILDAGKTALAAALTSQMMGFEARASSGKPPLPMTPIVLDLTNQEYAELANVGKAMKIPNPHDAKKPIIVTRVSETDVAAFSSKCTHLGCEVKLPENNVIDCPCHHSKFNLSGKVIRGPAGKDLPAFSATLQGTTVTIKDMT